MYDVCCSMSDKWHHAGAGVGPMPPPYYVGGPPRSRRVRGPVDGPVNNRDLATERRGVGTPGRMTQDERRLRKVMVVRVSRGQYAGWRRRRRGSICWCRRGRGGCWCGRRRRKRRRAVRWGGERGRGAGRADERGARGPSRVKFGAVAGVRKPARIIQAGGEHRGDEGHVKGSSLIVAARGRSGCGHWTKVQLTAAHVSAIADFPLPPGTVHP